MDDVLVCIPARRDDPKALFAGPVAAITANEALHATLDYSPDRAEEAEYAALVLASVWALTKYGERFVVTAEVAAAQVGDGDEAGNGGVSVTGLRRDQLVAWFDDQTDAAAAAGSVQGLSLDEAWEHDSVAAVLEHELLWHTIDEWAI